MRPSDQTFVASVAMDLFVLVDSERPLPPVQLRLLWRYPAAGPPPLVCEPPSEGL